MTTRCVARIAVAAVAAAVTGAVLLPDLLRIDTQPFFVECASLRPLTAPVLLCVGAAVALLRHRAWCFWVPVVAVGLVAEMLVVPRIVPRPIENIRGLDLTVLEFNVDDGAAAVDALAALVARDRPDLVALPESGDRFRSLIAARVASFGYRSWSSTAAGTPDVRSVTLLVADRVRDPQVVIADVTPFPYLALTAPALGRNTFYAAHAVSPFPYGGDREQWVHDVGVLTGLCRDHAIIAGDFNATLDQSVLYKNLHGCADAATQRGESLRATWPSALPRWAGIQIDHVLAASTIAVTSFDVVGLPGSDHRAILVGLRLPG